MLTVPEKLLYQTNVYMISSLKTKNGSVKITENRVLFESNDEVKTVPISDVKVVEVSKEVKNGFLISGFTFLLATFALYYQAFLGIKTMFEFMFFFALPTVLLTVSLLSIYWWVITRSYKLKLRNTSVSLEIRSKNLEDLIEIANAVELVRIGAIKKLPVKNIQSST